VKLEKEWPRLAAEFSATKFDVNAAVGGRFFRGTVGPGE